MRTDVIEVLKRLILLFIAIAAAGTAAEAKIVTNPVAYQSEGFQLEGYLAYNDAVTNKRPGVLVVHEWWGLNDSVRKRADLLASMGHIDFVLNLYGKGKTTTDLKQATKWLRMVQMNVYRWHPACAGRTRSPQGPAPQVDPQFRRLG